MSDHSTNGFSKESPKTNYPQATDEELAELRHLLLGIEPNQLNQLYEQLENKQIKPEDISRMLPQAVVLRTMQDRQLSESMIPTIEQAIQSSVKQDLNVLAEAIFPIIAPASRRAIATALGEMVQSLNQTLEHSVSPQSFKWRLEARQTGKSFAEVVMLRTLVYRVEQVFLIDKKTGLLLHHVVAPLVAVQDPDLVSAMLTAIQDFVKDSFSVKKEEGLETLQFGELTVWIEEGPQAVLAGIIRGNAPQELRLLFKDAIEKIHLRLYRELYDFQGESEPFLKSQPYLEGCLEARYKVPAKKNYTYAWVLMSLLAMGLGIWGFLTIREQQRWDSYVEQLNLQPGIIVTKAQKRNGKYFVEGMRDPLAIRPNTLLKKFNIPPEAIKSNWEPYLSLEPELTIERAEKLLQSPKTVTFKIDQNGILYASGYAPRQWILETRKLWRFVPGINQFQEANLADLDISQLNIYKNQIEEIILLFQEGTTELLPDEVGKLENINLETKKFIDAAKSLRKNVQIQIIGHTNRIGTEQRNIQLSQARANVILSYLVSKGINKEYFTTVGLGSTQPINSRLGPDRPKSRRVNFKVSITDTRNVTKKNLYGWCICNRKDKFNCTICS
jgi:outer membrane protein OmpA-like peptidoglycan-associated protein